MSSKIQLVILCLNYFKDDTFDCLLLYCIISIPLFGCEIFLEKAVNM